MDGNCIIITEILLVISYTTSYCKKYINIILTSYCPTLFILDQIRYSNLIRHYVDILLLALLEDREQIITVRNTQTNYQMTNSENHMHC